MRDGDGGLPEIPGYRWDGPVAHRQGILINAPALAKDGLPVTVHWSGTPIDKRGRERFLREAERLFAAKDDIASPHLVPFFGPATATDGTPVLVTGRYGRPITGGHRAHDVPTALVRSAALAFASTLDRLHGNDMLHHGVCPEAALVGTDGQVRIAVPRLPILAELTLAESSGTGHEPPEVLSGGDLTSAGEIYSLAATVWTLISGQRLDTRVRLAHDAPPPPHRADVSDAAVAALLAGLSRDPAARPTTALELVGPLVELSSAQEANTAPPARFLEPFGGVYAAEEKLGDGGSGTVYRVRRKTDDAVFAAKRMHTSLLHDNAAVNRMVGEWQAVRRLPPHPHLVRIHQVILDGEVTVVMELVAGPDLNDMLRRRAVGRGEGMRLLSEVAAALATVHDHGVVHRDVKPANVLVHTQDGRRRAKLTDFGIAKLLDQATTQQGVMMGTWPYLAPEAVDAAAARSPSDVYALGVMAYEVLAGYRPFREQGLRRLLAQHATQVPARPAELPDDVWEFVARCLRKRPGERPSAAEAVTAFTDLSRVVARSMPELPDSTAPPPDEASTDDLDLPGGPRFAERLERSVRDWSTDVSEQAPPPPVLVDAPARVPDEVANPTTHAPEYAPPQTKAPPARPKRRLRLAIALVCTVVLGLGVGGLVRHLRSERPPAQDEPTSNLRYVLPVTADPAEDGAVTLSWPDDAEPLRGFSGYLVQYGPGMTEVTDVPAGQTSLSIPEPGTGACFRVIALGVTAEPPAAPAPTCLSTTNPTAPTT